MKRKIIKKEWQNMKKINKEMLFFFFCNERKMSGNLPWIKLAEIWKIYIMNRGRKSSNRLHSIEELFKPFQSGIRLSNQRYSFTANSNNKVKFPLEFTVLNIVLILLDSYLHDALAQVKGLTMKFHVMHRSQEGLPVSLPSIKISGGVQGPFNPWYSFIEI